MLLCENRLSTAISTRSIRHRVLPVHRRSDQEPTSQHNSECKLLRRASKPAYPLPTSARIRVRRAAAPRGGGGADRLGPQRQRAIELLGLLHTSKVREQILVAYHILSPSPAAALLCYLAASPRPSPLRLFTGSARGGLEQEGRLREMTTDDGVWEDEENKGRERIGVREGRFGEARLHARP